MSKNILMIGGSHGIGLAVAQQLQGHHNVFIASRSAESLGELNVTHIPFNAAQDDLNLDVLPDTIHGFLYLPGSINLKPFKMMSMDTFHEDMQVNFFNMVAILQELLPRMADHSSLVFFSTVAVNTGMPYHTSVAAAKGAIEGFVKALAAEYAPKLRCNVIAPSLTDTPLAKRLLNNDKKREAMAARHPMQRIGNAEDIAHAAVFLLSDKSSWITGQVIGVDGGLSTLNIN